MAYKSKAVREEEMLSAATFTRVFEDADIKQTWTYNLKKYMFGPISTEIEYKNDPVPEKKKKKKSAKKAAKKVVKSKK
jgi:hypothetical protein